ncbi:hypothetical protein SRHO_G00335490 [Serrasalmus rhombeus]
MNCSTFLVLLMLAGATLGEIQKRIIGGHPCNDNEARHHVILTVINEEGHCGGSLIHPQWVLTVAHCKPNGIAIGNIRAILNHHSNPRSEIPAKIIQTIQYSNTDGDHDIMLMKLEKSFSGLNTVRLPSKNDCNTPLTKGSIVHVNGLFEAPIDPSTSIKGPSVTHNADTLHCGELKITDCEDMSVYRNHPTLHPYSYSWFLCAQDPNGNVDSCEGNSGGSMLQSNVLYGVIQSSDAKKCGLPVAFMDVCKYRDWIEKNAV